MHATTEDTLVIQKTRDLCQTIVDQVEFRLIRQRIDAFLNDTCAKEQYQLVMEKGDALHHKQQYGMPLDYAEFQEFEQHREVLLNNPIARDFIDAQQDMQRIQESVMQF